MEEPGSDSLCCPPLEQALLACTGSRHQLNFSGNTASWVELVIEQEEFENKIHSLFSENILKPFPSRSMAFLTHPNTFSINLPITQCLENIKKMASGSGSSLLLLVSKIIDLLSLQLTAASRQNNVQKEESPDDKIIRHLENYIHNNLARQVTIDELAKEAGINQTKLKHLFKNVYGQPVFSYIFSIKMNMAHDLLCHHDIKIQEVAYKTGYKNATHFSKAFKQHFGYLPSQIRVY
jgi:AraC-like DNA-binding protein